MVLRVSDAHKSYGGTPALQGASWSVQRGEWLALLGPNGAGKTTSVRAVAGRVRLDRGSVELLGRDLQGPGAADARRKLGVVPQNLAVYPDLTARENLLAFGQHNGLTGRPLHTRVDWALEWTGLADRAGELVQGYSGGMQRRLNLACGVLHEPEVILLDEPTVGVDPQSRERIWEMLAGLQRDGASLVLTTHQLDEAQSVCDRIVIIDHGRDIASGTLAELIRDTVGPARTVRLTLDRPPDDPDRLAGVTCEGRTVHSTLDNVADELQDLLARVAASGATVADLHVEAPTLHAVFLHLTGRELRE